MTYYNPWNKIKLPNFNDNLDPNLSLPVESDMSFLTLAKYKPRTPLANVIYKIADSDTISKLAVTDSHLIDP
jgi:hypothetical protein